MEVPDLSRLSLGVVNEEGSETGSSWFWNPQSYSVQFSIDTAIQEQLNKLQERPNAKAIYTPPMEREPTSSQLNVSEILSAVQEYTVQRIWDLYTSCPPIRNIPGSENDKIIRNAARWILAIRNIEARRVPGRGQWNLPQTPEEQLQEQNTNSNQTYDEICRALLHTQNTFNVKHAQLKRTLLAIEQFIKKVNTSSTLLDEIRNNESAKDYLITNKQNILNPTMANIRLLPPRNFYSPRSANARKYMYSLKMHLLLYPGNTIFDKQFVESFKLPHTLDGSFYSGRLDNTGNKQWSDPSRPAETRIGIMQLEHIVPISHMKNACLVREFGDPTQLVFNTVLVFPDENLEKSDHYLALSLDDTRMKSFHGPNVFVPNVSNFGKERRCMAARAICATYLSLFMIEHKPNPFTEIGGGHGGFYSTSGMVRTVTSNFAHSAHHTFSHLDASSSDSCVCIVACYTDFCVFFMSGT